MRVVSLFSGVGLLDLGLEWAGYRTVQLCELDSYCQRILTERFPGVPVHGDANTITPAACDVVAAGFPCQPASVAGLGLGTEDPRWLWPAVARTILLARPRYVILENVPGLVGRGLIGHVLRDLAAAGFDADWTTFAAAQVGAPHLRFRWWLVAAHPDRVRVWDEHGGFFRPGWGTEALAWAHGQTRPLAHTPRDAGPGESTARRTKRERTRTGSQPIALADADGERRDGRAGQLGAGRRGEPTDGGSEVPDTYGERSQRTNEPGDQDTKREATPGVRWEACGSGGWWSSERGLGRVAPRQPHRVDRLRALGNGVVPQCAELVGLRLRQLNSA